MKRYTKILMLVFFGSWMVCTFPGFAENISPSLAEHRSLSESKNLKVGGWFPDLTGLPDKDQVDVLSQHLSKLMSEEKHSK